MDEIDKIFEKYKPISDKITSTVSSGFLKIETHEFVLNNGETLVRDILIKENINAIMIIPRLKNGKFLMVVQPRPSTKNGVCLEFPAGYVEKGETVIEGATRELEEETGTISNKVEKIYTYYQDQACSKCLISVLFADDCEKVTSQKLDKDEFIDIISVSYDELIELQKKGYIVDANTTICLSVLKEKKFRGEL